MKCVEVKTENVAEQNNLLKRKCDDQCLLGYGRQEKRPKQGTWSRKEAQGVEIGETQVAKYPAG